MTKKNISEAISGIDNRYIEEFVSFQEEKEVFNMKKTNKSFWVKFGAIAASVCICAVAGFGIWKSGILTSPDAGTSQGGTQSGALAYNEAEIIGTGITAEEIDTYISENKELIVQLMQEYDLDIETVAIYKNGICHAATGGELNTVNLDSITLPILVNGEIYATVDIMRTDDGLLRTVNYGGDKWESYSGVIFGNPESDIVLAYLPDSMGEILILPDNTAMNPVIGEIENPIAILTPGIDWYNLLKTDYNTVNAKELRNPDNLVIIYEK